MRKCKVFVNGVEAGVLTEKDNPRGYEFRYLDSYLRGDYPDVCLAMPRREEKYRSDVLFPFFFNMLSEGENRKIQASILHIDKDDDFGILLETARYDTPGAVTVQPIKD